MNKIEKAFKILFIFVKVYLFLSLIFLTWATIFFVPNRCLNVNDYFCESSVIVMPIAILINAFLLIVLFLSAKKETSK